MIMNKGVVSDIHTNPYYVCNSDPLYIVDNLPTEAGENQISKTLKMEFEFEKDRKLYNVKRKIVDGNGNCGFLAICSDERVPRKLGSSDRDSLQDICLILRDKVANFVRSHRTYYKNTVVYEHSLYENVDDYANSMSSAHIVEQLKTGILDPKRWIDNTALSCIPSIIKIPIQVLKIQKDLSRESEHLVCASSEFFPVLKLNDDGYIILKENEGEIDETLSKIPPVYILFNGENHYDSADVTEMITKDQEIVEHIRKDYDKLNKRNLDIQGKIQKMIIEIDNLTKKGKKDKKDSQNQEKIKKLEEKIVKLREELNELKQPLRELKKNLQEKEEQLKEKQNPYVIKHQQPDNTHTKSSQDSSKQPGNPHVEIMGYKVQAHPPRHYQHLTDVGMGDKPYLDLWHTLFAFSKKVATESKYFVYKNLTKYLRKGNIEDFHIIGCSAVALAENNGVPFTVEETIHQIVRSFLHMHDSQLQAIIWAYLRHYYGLITEQEAFSVLVFVVQCELKHKFKESEPWDVGFLYTLTNTFGGRKLSVFMALHNGLKTLKNHVVLIEWIGDWKNFMKLHACEHGPLKPLIQGIRKVTIGCPDLKQLLKTIVCPYCQRMFPSLNLLKKHLHQKIFGNKETPMFQISKNEKDGKSYATPFKFEDSILTIHQGLLYENKENNERENLFFIRNDRQFRNCALLDIEDRHRQRVNNAILNKEDPVIYCGKLISVGIDVVECQRLVMKWKGKIKVKINPISVWDENIQTMKQELATCNQKIRNLTSTNTGLTNSIQSHKRNIEKNNSVEQYTALIIEKENKLVANETELNKIKQNSEELETQLETYYRTIVKDWQQDFNFHYFFHPKDSINKLIGFSRELKFLEKHFDNKKKTEEQKNNDIYRYTLIVFAILPLTVISEYIDLEIMDLQKKLSDQMNSSLTKIENMETDEKKFVTKLTENITEYFMHHGLTKKTKVDGRTQMQEFMSPFFAILLRNWLDPLKLDIGFEFQYKSSNDVQELPTLNTKIDNEWENMQKKYTVPGNSSTYEWHSDFSKLQLSLKDNESIDEILKWKIFVLKANNCNIESISNLQTKILEGVKENQLKKTKISYITDRSKLWKAISEKNETTAKETEKTIENGNGVSSIVSSGMSKFENQIFPDWIKTDFMLDFSSEFYKDKKMSEKQAYLFQSAKLLLWNLEREEISNDALMTIKWFGKLTIDIPTDAGPYSRRTTTSKTVNHSVNEHENPNDPPKTVKRKETIQKHIGTMRRNRDIKKDKDQKQYTYNNGGFQIIFLTLHEEILANRILGFISRFTDFSIPELITKVANYIEKIEDMSDQDKLSSIEYKIYKFIFDEDNYDDFANFLNGEIFKTDYEIDYEEILFEILQSIIGRPIYILKISKDTKNLLYLNKVYNSENTVFGEPIFLVDEFDDENGNLEMLMVEKYIAIQSNNPLNLRDVVKTWNTIPENLTITLDDNTNIEISIKMSYCKVFLYLIYRKIRQNITHATFDLLKKDLTGTYLTDFQSMENILDTVCEKYDVSREDYENLLLQNSEILFEDCYKLYLEVKKKVEKRKGVNGQKKSISSADAKQITQEVDEEYQTQISTQSGCRAVATLDGGYQHDTGEVSHSYGVKDGTDDEQDWDDIDYDSPNDPNEDDDERDKRKQEEAELRGVERRENQDFQGNSARNERVSFVNKKGVRKTRTLTGNEKSTLLKKQGDAKGLRENRYKTAAEKAKRAQDMSDNDD